MDLSPRFPISIQAKRLTRAEGWSSAAMSAGVSAAVRSGTGGVGVPFGLIRQIRPRVLSRSGWVRGTSLWEMILLYQSTT